MSGLIEVFNFGDSYVQLIDNNIEESFIDNDFYFYALDKTNRVIIGDDKGNLICRINLSGLKQKLVEDIIHKREKSIFTYKININLYNGYGNSSIRRLTINSKIFIDLGKLAEKIAIQNLDNFDTLDALIISKIYSLSKFNSDFWKKENIIKSNHDLSQPEILQVKLFQYQLKTLYWMVNLEKKIRQGNELKIETTFPAHHILNIDEDLNLKYDIINNKLTHEDNSENINLKGGILADEMGLGKTITSVALIAANPLTQNLPIISDRNKNYNTKATLIICPSHLTKQWAKEIEKGAPALKKISILTKVNHEKTSYQDIINADIVIVSLQFLINFNYYVRHNYGHTTPSQMEYN